MERGTALGTGVLSERVHGAARVGKEGETMKQVMIATAGWQHKLLLWFVALLAMACGMLAQAQDQPPLRITAKGDTRASVGDTLVYTVTVETAKGDREFPIVSNALVEYSVPAQLEPIEARSEIGSCNITGPSRIECRLGELLVNAKVRLDFVLRATAGGSATSDFVATARIFACEFSCDVGDKTSLTTDIAENVEPLSISPARAQIAVGQSLQFDVAGGQPPYDWASGDNAIATVDSNGNVTGQRAGRTTVFVMDAARQRASADIEIVEPVEPLRVDSHPTSLAVNDSFTLRASGGRPPYAWNSGDPAVATVDNEGTVRGVSPGTVRVRVTDTAGQEAQSEVITVFGALSVSPRTATLRVGESLDFSASGGVAPYTWRSSNDNVANINDNGRLTATAPGTVRVTVIDSAGQQAVTDDITVAASLQLNPRSASLVVGGSQVFTVEGGAAPYRWSVTDEAVASISQNGELSARAAGTVRVRVTDSLDQTVTSDDIRIVSRLSLAPDGGTVSVGSTLQFSVDGGATPYRWRVSDEERAQISDAGLLTARSVGTVTVTVTDASGQDATSGEVRIVDSLAISPLRGALTVGQTLQFQVSGGVGPYTWRSSNGEIARIDDNGLLTALAPGSVRITVNDRTGQSVTTEDITVAAALQISPRSGELVVGDTLQFQAAGGIGTLSWSVSDTELASISGNGLLTARAAGQVTVFVRDAQGNQARSDAIRIIAPLRVSPTSAVLAVGDTLPLQASGGIEPYEWQSSDSAIGQVDSRGTVTARSAGTLRITVTDRSGQRAVTGDITVASTLELSPRSATLVASESQTFRVQGGVAPYRWSVTDAAVASVSQNGELAALAAGTVRVRVSDALDQTVTSEDIRVVNRLSITPDGGTVSLGGTLQFNVAGGVGPYRWQVSDRERAQISDAGLLTARSVGTVTVSVSDDSGQTVTSGAVRIVDTLALSPSSGIVIVGETLQFQASGGTTPYRWRVSDSNLADIDGSGLLAAKQAGRVIVTLTDAQNNEVSSEAIELAGILTVTPRSASLAPGGTLQFAVSGGLGPYQWSSSDTSVASIDNQGLLTAAAAGRVRVGVSDRSGQRASSEDIEVRAGLSVAPAEITLQVDETASLAASGGTPPYQWASADPAIAAVDDAGRVTGIAAGETQLTLRDANADEVSVRVTVQAAPVEPPPDGGAGTPPTPGDPYRVSVYTSDANAVESGSSGAFTIVLDRPAAAPVTVRYRIGGADDAPRADNGILAESLAGIAPLPGEVTIATGEQSATVVIQPVNNDTADGARPIVLSLLPGEGYEIANESAAATLVVVDDDQTAPAPAADAPAALTMERIQGSATQNGRVSAELSFAVRVIASDGNPVPGAIIAWSLSTRGTNAGGQLQNEDTTTNAAGEAGVTLRTGSFPDVYEVNARASLDGANSASVSFLVNAGLADIVDPRTPEGAVGLALDSACPQLQRDAASLDASGQRLLERCTEIYSAFANGEDVALLEALRSLAPEEAAAQGTVGLRFALRQLRNIDERLRSLRRGQRELSLSGLSFNINGEVLPGSVFEAARSGQLQGGAAGDAIGDEPAASWLDERTGIFITGAVDLLEKTRTAQESGFDAQTQGITAGIDRRITDKWVIGAAVGYGTTDLDLSADGGKLDADGYSVSGYASYAWNERSFIDAILSYGSNDYDMLRRVDYTLSTATVQRSARGNTNGTQLSGALSGGYTWNSGGLDAELFGRVEHTRANIDAYQESGADELDLALADQTVEATYMSLGGLLSHTFSLGWGVLQPQASLSWEHAMADAYDIRGQFVADPTATSFTFQSDEPDSDYLRASVGVSALFANGFTAFVQYEETLQKDNFDESAVSAGLRFYRAF